MSNKNQPLRYNISSWDQLPGCTSNNSRKLKISVTNFINDSNLKGKRIAVKHEDYGTLFACVVNASGPLVCSSDTYRVSKRKSLNTKPNVYQLSNDTILRELEKFGFFVTYNKRDNLAKDQIDFLETLKGLHYDKLRILCTYEMIQGVEVTTPTIVVFMSEMHGQWLNNDYCAKKQELIDALIAGTAVNITDVSIKERYDWSWLNYVANIDDILRDNYSLDAQTVATKYEGV